MRFTLARNYSYDGELAKGRDALTLNNYLWVIVRRFWKSGDEMRAQSVAHAWDHYRAPPTTGCAFGASGKALSF